MKSELGMEGSVLHDGKVSKSSSSIWLDITAQSVVPECVPKIICTLLEVWTHSILPSTVQRALLNLLEDLGEPSGRVFYELQAL